MYIRIILLAEDEKLFIVGDVQFPSIIANYLCSQ